ncbi:MAG TPA: TIGR03435 family protein [Bryobacteraceae bacterium]|nr:TIGR03435 family protein [Bryobacteraceae bacterium]
MTTNLSRRKKLLLATAAVAAVTVPLLAGLADTTPAPTFEVASIKPSKPGPSKPGPFLVGFQIGRGAHFIVHGITPKLLLEEAYGVKDAQISQVPPWFDTDRYDIDAKPEEPVGAAIDKLPRDDQKDKLMQMVQALLADRFKLAISHESKEMSIYAMVVAKGGPKMKVSDFKPPEHPEALPPMPPKSGNQAMRGRIMFRPGNLTSTGIEMRMLADALSRFTGRPVIDKTNLSGRYEFTLQWTPDTNQMPIAGMVAPGGGPEAATAPESNGPSLVTAIREQLGLRLESQKAPMDVLVITHAEKPSGN